VCTIKTNNKLIVHFDGEAVLDSETGLEKM